MIRTALRNGAVFEIPYATALDSAAKRNWWAAAREVVRVTKGKGLIVTGGGMEAADLRAPRDIGNLCVESLTPYRRTPNWEHQNNVPRPCPKSSP